MSKLNPGQCVTIMTPGRQSVYQVNHISTFSGIEHYGLVKQMGAEDHPYCMFMPVSLVDDLKPGEGITGLLGGNNER